MGFPRWSASVAVAALAQPVLGVNNGLARTPQMGWNNWNSLGCDVSEQLLIDTSQKLVDLGLKDVGYSYVVLDDCWSDGRDTQGHIEVDTGKFPHGMKWVAQKIHDLGLLYGMYSSAGEHTCARYVGSLDHEKEDAKSFASWDVDYLKYDNCYHRGRFGYPEVSFNRYNAMAQALNATGRPILYSLCNWGEDYVFTWGVSIANSWRISGDIYDSFTRPDDLCSCTMTEGSAYDPHCVAPGTHCSVLTILNRVAPYADKGQYGGWNDLDMLEVGQGGMTDEEYKAHFALWAAVKSPLLIGADIRSLSAEALTILNNPAIIAVSQDPLGRPAHRVSRDLNVPKDQYGVGETQVWAGPLWGGDQLLLLLNAADKDLQMTATPEDIFVADGPGGSAPQVDQAWDVHDLWADRMGAKTAEDLLSATAGTAKSPERVYESVNWFNSTQVSYADALRAVDERILGKKIGEIKMGGEWKVKVPRHAAKVYRLRSQSGTAPKRYSTTKDEL